MDAVCAATLFGPLGQQPDLGSLIVLYSTLAFSTQCLVGLLVDRCRGLRWAAAAGMVCIALGFFLPLPARGRGIFIGLGNSVFHVTAGSLTLQNSGFRAAALGCFVAPGAIGVSLGSILPAWGSALALIVCANVFTKLSLNLCLLTVLPRFPLWILAAEAAVVWGEASLYTRALGASGRLYLLTFLANCLSFGIGLLLT